MSRFEQGDRDRYGYERERLSGGGDRRERFESRDRQFRAPASRLRDHSDERHDRRPRAYDDDMYLPDRRPYQDEPRGGFDRRGDRGFEREVMFEKERPRGMVRELSPPPPPAPRATRPGGMVRRQSSLDTFDRRPLHFYGQQQERYGPPARREDYRPDPYAPPPPTAPLPRSRQLGPPRRADDRADPDLYGDDDDDDFPAFPTERVREREMVRTRRRQRSPDSMTSKTYTRTSRSSSVSSRSSSRSRTTVQSTYPKKGKTKIPSRLISKRALIDLRYPFIEEGTNIIILQALGQDQINEVLRVSEEYRKSELDTLAARSSAGNLTEDRRDEIFIPPPPPPASSTAADLPPPPPPAAVERDVVVKKEVVIRDASPSRYSTTTGTTTTGGTVILDSGPLVHRHRSRSRSTRREGGRAEMRALEQGLASRRRSRVGDVVQHAERLSDGQVVLYEERVERVEEGRRPPRIEKDRKGRMSISVPKHR